MIQFFKKNIESNKKLRTFEIIVLCLLIFTSIGSVFYGLMQIHKDVGDLQYVQSVTMDRDKDEEDYDSDNKVCDVIYRKGDQKLVVSYDYEDYVNLNKNSIKAYEFKTENGQNLYFDHNNLNPILFLVDPNIVKHFFQWLFLYIFHFVLVFQSPLNVFVHLIVYLKSNPYF